MLSYRGTGLFSAKGGETETQKSKRICWFALRLGGQSWARISGLKPSPKFLLWPVSPTHAGELYQSTDFQASFDFIYLRSKIKQLPPLKKPKLKKKIYYYASICCYGKKNKVRKYKKTNKENKDHPLSCHITIHILGSIFLLWLCNVHI